MSEHFVYIIGHMDRSGVVEGPVKVGITKSLGSRLASIQTGNWRRIQFCHVFNLEERHIAVEVERMFHDVNSDSRLSGEWFAMEPFTALKSLCGIVYTTIEHMYPEDECQEHWVESGTIDALKMIYDGTEAP